MGRQLSPSTGYGELQTRLGRYVWRLRVEDIHGALQKDARNSAAAYIPNCGAPDVTYDHAYDGSGVSLDSAPQRVPVSLIRLDGSVALTGHYIVDIIFTHDGHNPSEHFVGSSRQIIHLSGHRDLEPGNILGTASAPLVHVPLGGIGTT